VAHAFAQRRAVYAGIGFVSYRENRDRHRIRLLASLRTGSARAGDTSS
jgi:hypothetical protein